MTPHSSRFKKWCYSAAPITLIMLLLLFIPLLADAQGTPEYIKGLHGKLAGLKAKFLPRISVLIDFARAVGSFGATFYIGHRVWKHIAQAEPIDFYPLFRPFCLGICIGFFPTIITLTDSILQPTVTGTEKLVEESNKSIEMLLAKREAELKNSDSYRMFGINDGEGDRAFWLKHTQPEVRSEGLLGSITNDMRFAMDKAYYNFKNWFKSAVSFVLQLLYEAAALCINTIRTFNLIICAILGPFVFALAIYDGFQHSLVVWLARYINYFLWLPVANILAAVLGIIQEEMINLDIQQIQQFGGDAFFTTEDIGYLIFMIIGIIAYTTVPNMAAMIVNPGGGSAITAKITNFSRNTAMTVATGTLGATASGLEAGGKFTGMVADSFGDNYNRSMGGYAGHGTNSGYMQDKLNG